MKSPMANSSSESSSAVGNTKAAGPLERDSCISCECHQSSGRRRCSASPQHEGQEGKENTLMVGQDSDSCVMNSIWDKYEPEHMDYEETSRIMFPDDDSNQILPVEQFFGNLDAVQVRHVCFNSWGKQGCLLFFFLFGKENVCLLMISSEESSSISIHLKLHF